MKIHMYIIFLCILYPVNISKSLFCDFLFRFNQIDHDESRIYPYGYILRPKSLGYILMDFGLKNQTFFRYFGSWINKKRS